MDEFLLENDAAKATCPKSGKLLSVIIPVFNSQSYLSECINSFLSYPDERMELILVDDGSYDKSGEICDAFSMRDSRIRVFHKSNEGASVARNFGISKASGQWISFVDSDDIISDSYFTTFLKYKDDCDWIIFSLTLLGEDGSVDDKIIKNERIYRGQTEIQSAAYELMTAYPKCEFLVFTVNKFYKRETIIDHNIQFTQGLSFREDELFALEYCLHATCLRTCSSSLYYYRNTISGSLSHTKKKTSDYILFSKSLLRISSHLENSPLKELEYLRALDFLINSYQPDLNKTEREDLYYSIKAIVKKNKVYLSSLKKTPYLSIIFSLPNSIAFSIISLYLNYIYKKNNIQLSNDN